MRDQESGRPVVYKSFLFGCFSGMTSAILLQPLDVVKTRLQLNYQPSMLARHNGMVWTFLHIVRKEHPLALWKGLLPSVSRVVPGVGIYFSTLTFLSNQLFTLHLSPMQSLVIAAIARFVTCMTLQPFTVLKTRFESGWFRYSGMMQAVKEMLRHEGVKSLYSGLGATIVRDVPFSSLYFMFYNMMKQSVLFDQQSPIPTSAALFTSGVVSGVMASLITHPPDVIKTRVQTQPQRYRNSAHAAVQIIRTESPKILFSGILPRLIRKTLMTALSWTLFETLSARLG